MTSPGGSLLHHSTLHQQQLGHYRRSRRGTYRCRSGRAAWAQALSQTQQEAAPQSREQLQSQADWLSPASMAACYPIAALPSNIDRAVSALRSGQVIAIPTDTLYGLEADASSPQAIQQISSIKHRQGNAPPAICIAELSKPALAFFHAAQSSAVRVLCTREASVS